MTLVERSLSTAEVELGSGARVVEVIVDHAERCVLDVILPDGTPAILKATEEVGDAAAEAAVLRAAGRAGVPVPQVLTRSAGPPAVLLLSRVEGDWLSPDRSDAAWAAAAAALRALHRVEVLELRWPSGGRSWPDGLERGLDRCWPIVRAAGLDSNVCRRVAAATRSLPRLPPELVAATLHGDCMPIHVRLDGNDRLTGLIDLGDTCRGDPAWDLTVLALRSPERLPAVLDGYGADEGMRAWLPRVRPTYRAIRHVVEVGWLAEHGFDPSAAVLEATTATAGLCGG